MVAYDEMSIDSLLSKSVEEHSLGPVERPVVDVLANIKAVAKMNASANATLLKCRKESFTIKLFKVIVENLTALANTEMGVSDNCYLMLFQTFEDKLRLDYSRSPLVNQAPLPPDQQESAPYQESVGSSESANHHELSGSVASR